MTSLGSIHSFSGSFKQVTFSSQLLRADERKRMHDRLHEAVKSNKGAGFRLLQDNNRIGCSFTSMGSGVPPAETLTIRRDGFNSERGFFVRYNPDGTIVPLSSSDTITQQQGDEVLQRCFNALTKNQVRFYDTPVKY